MAILAIGALAVIVVGYLVYQKSSAGVVGEDSKKVYTNSPQENGRAPNRAAGEKPVTYKRQNLFPKKKCLGHGRHALKISKLC